MVQQHKGRIKILEDHEIDELYGLPRFYPDDRTYYFSLTQAERDISNSYRTLENRVLFILQVGYFKAKTMFFSFEFNEVHDDVRHILQQHFSFSPDIQWIEPVLRQTKHPQQQKILALYGYRTCNALERIRLVEKALQFVKISAKPIYLFQMLIHYLETHRIVVPGYRFLQDILSLFLDEGIADDVAFSEVKRRAFTILDRDKFQQVSQYMNNQSFKDSVFEWEFIAAFAPAFKQHLRPLLMQLSFTGHRSDNELIEAIEFLKTSFDKGKSLNRYSFDKIPKAFIPQGLKLYLYEEDENGDMHIHPDKYEFLVYRLLRNHIEAGDVYISNSIRFRSFEDDLIPLQMWQDNKEKILKEADIPGLAKPITELLQDLETELETKYEEVNRRILSGENAHIKLTKRRGGITWSLPYVRDEDIVNNPFFDNLPQISIANLLQFVDSRCQCLDAFTHILNRYVKSPMDQQSIVASLVAYGTNVGLGKMGEISDLNYQTLYTAANSFLRPETLRDSNDRVSNAMAKLSIFRHYDIDEEIHSSSDGQKFETQFSTIRSRHSPKYFGLKKGISQYTLVANHVPINVRIFGANDHESHYVFDVLYNNTTDIKPTIP